MRFGAVAGLVTTALGAHSVLAVKQGVTETLAEGPVAKVKTLLEDLQAKVEAEGYAEAKTYNEYACFCKEKTAEKSKAITDGESEITRLNSELSSFISDRDTMVEDINTTATDLQTAHDDMDTETEDWANKTEVFQATHKNLTASVFGLNAAVKELQRRQAKVSAQSTGDIDGVAGPALVEVAHVIASNPAVKVSAKAKQVVMAAVAARQGSKVPVKDFTGHLGDIIDTLKGLASDFTTNLNDLERDRKEDRSTHELELQRLQGEINAHEVQLSDQKKELARLNQGVESTTKELSQYSVSLHDDQTYLTDLTETCNAKHDQWEQRSTMRAEELGALTEALGIVTKEVAAKEGVTNKGAGKRVLYQIPEAAKSHPTSFIQLQQLHDAVARAAPVQQKDDEDSTLDITDGNVDLSAHSFLQRGRKVDPKQRLVALLRSKGKLLHSKFLSELAESVKADPFAKIKTLIQNMIERLLEEAQEDATHKQWCDEEMGKAETKRGYQADLTGQLTQEILGLESKRAELRKVNRTLTREINDLDATLTNATAERADEKAENEQDIADAQEGKAAVKEAIRVLKDFYAKAKAGESSASFVQKKGPEDDAPESVEDKDYQGSQGAGNGIIGMLEVIEGDFERSETKTQEAEAAALQSFTEFKRATEQSLDTKRALRTDARTKLGDTATALETKVGELETEQGLLNDAVKELEKLKPACVTLDVVSKDDRAAARKDEIEALKQALCILEDPNGSNMC
mmetsp:Transcript_40086/g.87501  ORF Transcript_40086/g.87501 Transcript_40086/m.87501 type:complete len:746 (-) Transcript_40086:40-2277(-)|eukprot:CAMPEP_0204257064 /NCGR_PEP_ID=MMETSP0468-20130131/4171_1 /ASSEMBLY_ACC=CAM_ASM_000383 /TAXON_ID=2969 /ORGANISM="Oxyrrhis marina" /LENGTH=745 /DNA_ID=CAMNT_0051231111 /DNA_START=101 /DNA_END=2338 /DNA_ORIENTATION=+